LIALQLEHERLQRYQKLTHAALWVSNFDVCPKTTINQTLDSYIICTMTIVELGQQHHQINERVTVAAGPQIEPQLPNLARYLRFSKFTIAPGGKCKMEPQLDSGRFLPDPFQFIIDQSF
jgi:hypothetical protein